VNSILNPLRNAIRAVGRPAAAAVRKLLEPALPKIEYQFVSIESGPAKGCRILVPQPTELARSIASGEFERAGATLLQSLIVPNDVCYDIGGHYGYYSLVMSKLSGAGQVHCFEPVPDLANRISQTFVESKLQNAQVHRVAMAGQVGQMQFRFAGDTTLDDSMGHLEAYGGVNTSRSQDQYGSFTQVTVPTVTLDSLVDLPDPQFIKIDAEGAEAEILQAGLERLQRAKPRMFIELHGVDLALRCADILGQLGYVGIAAAERSLMMPVLWIHREDGFAIDAVNRHFQGNPPMVFSKLD
jgi:FkbM family methyltransferase